MTRTGLSPKLAIHRREPLVEIHPTDAALYGCEEGALARISSSYGEAIFRVAISEGQRPGEIFTPIHWTDMTSGGGRTGRLISQLTDPHSGQPAFKNTPATIAPVIPEWRAFLVSRDLVELNASLYWSRARIEQGWLAELAGIGAVDVDALLPDGARSEVVDMVRGMRRVAVFDQENRLVAALYVTRTGELPSREWIGKQLGEGGAGLGELLAGRPAQPQPDRGPIVCVCHDVGEQDVLAAASAGACSVQQIGECTRAGTNCGSCRPIIARLIDEMQEGLEKAAQ